MQITHYFVVMCALFVSFQGFSAEDQQCVHIKMLDELKQRALQGDACAQEELAEMLRQELHFSRDGGFEIIQKESIDRMRLWQQLKDNVANYLEPIWMCNLINPFAASRGFRPMPLKHATELKVRAYNSQLPIDYYHAGKEFLEAYEMCALENIDMRLSLKDAESCLIRAVENGYDKAIPLLAAAYFYNDKDEAFVEMAHKAIEHHHYEAYHYLGIYYDISKNYYKSRKYYEKSLETENAHAFADDSRINLAILLQESLGGPKHHQRAQSLLEELASQDHPMALFNKAVSYHKGSGSECDPQKTFSYIKQLQSLVEQNQEGQLTVGWFSFLNIPCYVNLGYCYERGIGTSVNLNSAYALYDQCVANNDPVAKVNKARILWMQSHFEQNNQKEKQAKEIYKNIVRCSENVKRERAGYAAFCLGAMHLEDSSNNDEKESLNQAFLYFKKASDNGDVLSKVQLGIAHWYGFIVPKDQERTKQLFADVMNAPMTCATRIAQAYLYKLGIGGIERNIEKAESYIDTLEDYEDDIALPRSFLLPRFKEEIKHVGNKASEADVSNYLSRPEVQQNLSNRVQVCGSTITSIDAVNRIIELRNSSGKYDTIRLHIAALPEKNLKFPFAKDKRIGSQKGSNHKFTQGVDVIISEFGVNVPFITREDRYLLEGEMISSKQQSKPLQGQFQYTFRKNRMGGAILYHRFFDARASKQEDVSWSASLQKIESKK